MDIKPTDFVLEIGSGHNPKAESDVLCDKFVEYNGERKEKLVVDRMFVAADGQYLPFADKSFDYVICSHILEHVENPELFIKELMRVGQRGYIETPSEIAEYLYGWHFHKWVFNLIDGKLIIKKNPQKNQFGQLFHWLYAHDKNFAKFHEQYHNLFNIKYEWSDKINYEIFPPGPLLYNLEKLEVVEMLVRLPNVSLIRQSGGIFRGLFLNRIQNLIKKFISKNNKFKRPLKKLNEIIVCPACKGKVEWQKDKILCHNCHFVFLIKNGIPELLIKTNEL